MSGLNVNFAKCRVLRVNKDEFFLGSDEVYELQSGNFFFVYLSWPPGGTNPRKASTWNPMVEAIKNYILEEYMSILEEAWFLLI